MRIGTFSEIAQRVGTASAAAAAVVLLAVAPAGAQFYKGKTLNVVINYGAGGNTTVQARLFMKHMEKYIPGNPRIVIRNMGGAGGKIGTNYLGEAAKKNGSEMGWFTINLISEILKDPGLRVSHADFRVIGGLGEQAVAYVRRDVPPGISTQADLFKVKDGLKSGGHDPASTKDIMIRLGLELLNVPYKHVYGYKSGAQLGKAVQQNEINFMEDSTPGYRGRVEPTMVKTGIVLPMWHQGIPVKGGGMKSDPDFADIPSFLDVYHLKYGKDAMPSGNRWKAFWLLAAMRGQMQRAVLLPKGAPDAAVADLRKAFEATIKDPAYIEGYKKLNQALPSPISGAEAEDYIEHEIKRVDPEIAKFLTAFVERARK